MTGRSLSVALFLTRKWMRHGHKGLVITPIMIMTLIFINLLFIPGLIEGAKQTNTRQMTQTFTSDYIIKPSFNEADLTDVNHRLKLIRDVQGVEAATAVLQVGNKLISNGAGGYWTVFAIDPESYNKVFTHQITSGDNLKADQQDSIVLGALIAGNGYENQSNFNTTLRGVNLGQAIHLSLYNHGDREYKVAGVFHDKFYDSDIRGFISRIDYDRINPASADRATSIFVKKSEGAGDIKQQLQQIVPTGQIVDPEQISGNFIEQAKMYQSINYIIGAMALLVGSVTIFIVTYIDLAQRRRQIGIERAIGIQSVSIVSHYLLRAIMCTLIGVLVGTGIFLLVIVPLSTIFPLSLPVGEVSLVAQPGYVFFYATLLIIVSVVSALIPSLMAVRVRLLDAIWGTGL